MQTKEQYEAGKGDKLVTFMYSTLDENKFVVEVTKDTDYFKEGELRTFVRK